MKKYRTLAALVKAIKDGEIPADVVSPGKAGEILGITRSAVSQRVNKFKTLEAFVAEDVILISMRSVKAALDKKRAVPAGQGELDVSTT